MRSIGHGLKKIVFILLSVVVLASGSKSYSQGYAETGISEVIAVANDMLRRNDYNGAIPPLNEIVTRLDGTTDIELQTSLQKCRYQLARCLLNVGTLDEAAEHLNRYLDSQPRMRERDALSLLAQIYFSQEKWDEMIVVCKKILNAPGAKREKDIVLANMLMGQAYYRQEMFNECIPPLRIAARRTDNDEYKIIMEIMVARAFVKTERFGELFVWLPQIYRSNAKYDITLNLTLMQAGKQRYEKEDFLNALLLYRMVLPRGILLDFQDKKLKEIKTQIVNREELELTDTDVKQLKEREKQLGESMKTLKELPEYEDEVVYRMGEIYKKLFRYWESYALFDKLYVSKPENDMGQTAFLQSALDLEKLQEFDKLRERVIDYVEVFPNGQYARTLLALVVRDRLMKKDNLTAISMKKYVEALGEASSHEESMLEADLHYMLAFAYLSLRNYQLAGDHFGVVIDSYPESANVPDSTYYRGLCFLFSQDYKSALDYFMLYEREYAYQYGEEAEHAGTVIFRQGVCYYGLQDVVTAESEFSRFIEHSPDHELVSEGYSMRGDIRAAKEAVYGEPDPLTMAAGDYMKGLDTATVENQASYAVFQCAKVFELDRKWQEIIDLMDRYTEKYGEESDVAQAVYWIGLSKMNLGQKKEAVDAYVNAIRDYGDKKEIEGVDRIIDELAGMANMLDEENLARLKDRLASLVKSVKTDQKVLNIRAKVAVAAVEGKEELAKLGAEFLSLNLDFNIMTPLSLGILSQAASESKNASEMERIAAYFFETYPDSELLWQAYRLKARALELNGEYEAILDVIEDAQDNFGSDSYMGWAQILKAETYMQLGNAEQAFEEFKMVQGVSAWRGALFAESMYGMGRSKLAAGDATGARVYFQRTYLLYRAQAKGLWAAKAYMADVDILLEQGDKAGAVAVLNKMITDDYVNTRPEAKKAKELLNKYGSVQTNE